MKVPSSFSLATCSTKLALARLPKELVASIVMLEQHDRRILSRSHYRICEDLCAKPGFHGTKAFTVDLIKTSASVLDFLLKAKRMPELDKVQHVEEQMEEYVKFLTSARTLYSPHSVIPRSDRVAVPHVAVRPLQRVHC